jgi:deoxyribonuclease IV
MELRIGPSGLGGKNEAIANLERYAKLGLKVCELAFTYSVYLDKKSAEIIGKRAKELDISLSIHAPYFVNLNSNEQAKIEATEKRILSCCEIGHALSAGDSTSKTSIVFHPGYYGDDRILALKTIKERIGALQEIVDKEKWNVVLCPELMGKINVFGSIDEIAEIVKEVGCGCCIDFAHVWARSQGDNKFAEIEKAFGKMEKWHCHFSGIIYTDKGEKEHRHTEPAEWKNLFNFLKKLKSVKKIDIVCEAPDPASDAKEGLEISKKIF